MGAQMTPKTCALPVSDATPSRGRISRGLTPRLEDLERLFDPRHQAWHEHFELRAALIVGLTATGRTTVSVLMVNEGRRVQLRAALIARGEF